MGMTPQYFHTIPTSCAILPTMHTTELSHCAHWPILNECITTQQGNQHYSFHSLLHARQPICSMLSSNKSLLHNQHLNMPYRPSTTMQSTAFTYTRQNMLSSSHQQHDLSMHINWHYTHACSTNHPTAFQNPLFLCTQHTENHS